MIELSLWEILAFAMSGSAMIGSFIAIHDVDRFIKESNDRYMRMLDRLDNSRDSSDIQYDALVDYITENTRTLEELIGIRKGVRREEKKND